MNLRGRAGAFLFEAGAAPPADHVDAVADVAAAAAPRTAVVLGTADVVVPVAAACAGELRVRRRVAAALVCVWRPHDGSTDEPAAPPSPAGAATPAARRLAQRIGARGAPATACGRLGWLALESAPSLAESAARRILAAIEDPVVIALAGPRPAAFEPLLAELDLGLVVLAPDTDPALRALALAGVPARRAAVQRPLPPGPARWAALAGLARLRALTAEER